MKMQISLFVFNQDFISSNKSKILAQFLVLILDFWSQFQFSHHSLQTMSCGTFQPLTFVCNNFSEPFRLIQFCQSIDGQRNIGFWIMPSQKMIGNILWSYE